MRLFDLANTQPQVAKDIESTLESGFLPQSLLFAGPRGSSRLTGALDLAFLLSGDSNNRELLKSSQIVFLPARNLESEARAAISLFERQRTDRSRIFLLQCIRKILFQYHSCLIDASDKKASGYFSNAEEIASVLYDFDESREYGDKEIKSLLSVFNKNLTSSFITKGKKSQSVAIDEIRGIQEWFSTGSDEKIAIFENVEDSTEGAKNSLLKVLEEPTPHSHLILISSNPQKLLQTILSRTRRFNFPSLTEKNVSAFIRDRFNIYDDFASFEGFFFQEGASSEDRAMLDDAVSLFSSLLIDEKERIGNADRERLFEEIDTINSYRYFLECVTDRVRAAMKSGRLLPIDARNRMDIVNKWIVNSETYNLSQRASLDGMLREVESVQ